jgi:DNA primase
LSINDREILTRQIRDAVDIVDLVSGYVRLTRAGSLFKGLCPFHEEKTPSFFVHPVKQFFKCHGCGAGGDVYKFMQLREKVDFVEARRMLADRAGISLDAESRVQHAGPGKTDLAKANEWAQQVFRRYYLDPAIGEYARAYVAERGISDEMAVAFGIGLSVNSFDALIRQAGLAKIDLKILVAAGLIKEKPDGGYYDTFRNRLMFPIHDASGRIIAFGGRTMGDDPAKYLNTPATALFDKSSNLFGLNQARQSVEKAGQAIVVEGYTDCIMAHQFGFTETVATLGTAMTDAHAALLRRYTDRVVLLFDSDAAGQKAADRALSVTLTGGLDVALTRVPDGKDPCDYLLLAGRAGFEEVLKARVPALEFKWNQVADQFAAGETGPGRRRAIEAFLNDLAVWLGRGSLDPIQKGLLLNQLGKLLSLPAEELHRYLAGAMRQTKPKSSPGAHSFGPGENVAERDHTESTSCAEQEAYRQILEVLLNEPGHFAAVADLLDPAMIRDPDLCAIVVHLADLLKSEEHFRLVDLIARFESPRYGGMITELATRGELRGKYAETIDWAMDCLHRSRAARQTVRLVDEVLRGRQGTGPQAGGQVPVGEDEHLQALAANAKNPHFAPARARRKALG